MVGYGRCFINGYFKTTKRKSLEMSKIHSKGGQDELILRKLLWHIRGKKEES